MNFEEAATGDALARIAKFAERAKEIQESIAAGGTSVEGPSGLVTMRVSFSGELEELTIDPRAMRLDSESLAQEIMGTYEEALGATREKMSDLLGELMEDEDLGVLMTPGNTDALNTLTESSLKDAMAQMEAATSKLRRRF